MVNVGFEAVIFDCDGVLVDSEVLSIKGERVALQEFGLAYSPEAYVHQFVGLHDRAFFDQLRADYIDAFQKDPPDDFEERILEGRRRERHALKPIALAGEALRAAKAKFGRIGVASSSRAHFLKSKLERTDLYASAGPHVYSADLVDHGKPAPDIFLYAAEKIGVAPDRCLVLEDSVNGVKAALAAGMEAWGFLGGGHCFDGHGARLLDAGAIRTVPDFASFLEILNNTKAEE